MYDINSHQDGYCLLRHMDATYHLDDEDFVPVRQMVLYCLRPSEENSSIVDFDFNNTIDPNFTFAKLKEQNITSDMLLGWSASIDLAERYELFLNNDLNSLFESETLFYNCTSLWFGPLCRFTFDYGMNYSFNDIVANTFKSKSVIKQDVEVTCYQHLYCQTKLSCLDWREICNGRSECLDGSDENNCWQLEVNECNDNEFRCHIGLCIPIEFFRDMALYPDCLDKTDESNYAFNDCYKESVFSCEEHMCPLGPNNFPCGDGECTNGIRRCSNGRTAVLKADFCSNATACSMKPNNDLVDSEWCKKFNTSLNCTQDNTTMLYEFRYIPRLFGHVRLIFSSEPVEPGKFPLPNLVCYDNKLCEDFLPATVPFNNLTCRHFNDLGLKNIDSYRNVEQIVENIKNRFGACLVITDEMDYCNYSTMYRCKNSTKCISNQRLVDGIRDCPFDDDETFNQSCSLNDIRQRFKCYDNGQEKCFASLIIRDKKKDCTNGEDERGKLEKIPETHISFQKICDGKTELSPVLIDERNETDETECKPHWPCNNTYSRCDKFWLCKDGADEINCPPSTCPALHHSCIFPNDTSVVSCLPITQAGNDIDNCLGATDERRYYSVDSLNWARYYFQCWNNSKFIVIGQLCNNETDCPFNDDESFCKNVQSSGLASCFDWQFRPKTDAELFLCNFNIPMKLPNSFFKLSNMKTYPLQLNIANDSQSTVTNTLSIQKDPIINMASDYVWRCNRGISIRIRMEGNTSKLYCLCPPNYYGDRCQYQNQRVSLIIQIRVSSDWRSVFIFLITLIDNERNIHSHDHIKYLPLRECKTKFNVYLLYSTRSKNASKNYSVQIDAFNQSVSNYRASWIFPLRFPFLPVHRLPVLLKVPMSNIKPRRECWSPCIHGQCFAYINDPHSTFCRCEPGWSGVQCDVEYKCNCAPNSLCISDSICLCPPGRFGARCHLFQHPRYSEPCLNGGHYVPADIRYVSTYLGNIICICADGYVGNRCEYQQRRTRIDISFHYKLTIPSSLQIHLIAVQKNKEHNRTSVMKKIGFDQYSLIVYTLVSFHIAFAQLSNHYYLIILQNQPITSVHITTQIIPSHRCRSIGELFNETFSNQHLLKRIKYYHIVCLQQIELVCFYDNVQLCLCNLDRQANCFEFDHNMTYDCGGDNICENKGHCFQDDPKCPTPTICACQQCYFGSRCQFSTKGSTLSLDIILGHHMHSKIKISQQPIIVKVAIALTTVIFVIGVINSFLTFQTFKEQETRNVGCSLYLFASSIVSMSTVLVFTVKFWLLLASQIASIKNPSFLHVQCVFMNFLLRFLLSTSDWLSACVAIERAVSVLKAVNFDKTKSKKMAKWMILIVLIFASCTYIYDPLHRRLMDDEEEQHTWCVHNYSSSLQILDWLMNIFHFFVPFSINCISAPIVIIVIARTRSNSQKKKLFKEHLREQVQQHKHLLISPLILLVLAFPRLIISFLSGCMKSARESWLYLIGYFISFIPPMMTFVVFVLPSEMYKKQFIESIKRIYI